MCVNVRKRSQTRTRKSRKFVGIYNKFEYTRSCANVSIINCATKMESMLQYSRKRKSFTRTVQSHTQRTPPQKPCSEHCLTKVHAITTKVRRTPRHTAVRVKRTLNDHGRSANRCRGSIRGRCVVRVQKVQEEIGTHENPIPFVRVPRSATNCLFAKRAVTPRALAMMIWCFSCIFSKIKQKAPCVNSCSTNRSSHEYQCTVRQSSTMSCPNSVWVNLRGIRRRPAKATGCGRASIYYSQMDHVRRT